MNLGISLIEGGLMRNPPINNQPLGLHNVKIVAIGRKGEC